MPTGPTVRFTAPETAIVEDREVADPGPGGLLVETTCSLISTGTELTLYAGQYPDDSAWADYGSYPLVPGYSNVGRVIAIGEDVDEAYRDARVASWAGQTAYHTLTPEQCILVPDGVADEEAAFFAIAQIVMNGIRRGRVDWGETVAIFGLGLLGQFATRFSRIAGAWPVVGVDLAEHRLSFLPDEAGVIPVNATDADPAAVLEDETGRLADVCYEVTGLPDAIPEQFESLRRQGRFVVLSSPRGETTFDFHDLCNSPSYEIIGAHQGSHPPVSTPQNPWTKERHAELFFEFLRADQLDVASLITRRVDPADAPATYAHLLDSRTDELGVLFEW